MIKLMPIKLKKDKKGSIVDTIVWVVVAFITVIFLALLLFAVGKIKDVFNQIPDSQGVNATKIMDSTINPVYNAMETNLKWISYMILFAMILSIFIHNYLIKVNWAFIFLYIVISAGAVIVAVPLSNTYEQLLSDSSIGSTLQSFSGSTYIMLYLPIFVIVIGLIGLIFLFIGIMTREGEGSIDTSSSII